MFNVLRGVEQTLVNLYRKHKFIFLLLFSALIIIWQWEMIFSSGHTAPGDFDYFAQAYEAIRRTILEYHQFPWMNAWVGGGVPLYANPQIGVFSIQTLLVIVFGTLLGLKLSLLFYSLAGFWSMFYLLKKVFRADLLISLALSVIWVTNGFFTSHAVGHYTFALFQLFPLLLFFIFRIRERHYWAYLGLTLALLALSSFHYATIQSILFLGFIALFLTIKKRRYVKSYIWLYFKSGLLFMTLSIHRIIYTTSYALEFPRTILNTSSKLSVILKTFVIPPNQTEWFYHFLIKPVSQAEVSPYAWGEFNAFVGLLFTIAFVCSLIYLFVLIKKPSRAAGKHIDLALLGLAPFVIMFIALGTFSKHSPYSFIHSLPGFSAMQIPSRWLVWAILFALVFVGAIYNYIPTKPRLAILLLVTLGTIEVYAVTFPLNNKFTLSVFTFRDSSQPFQQFENYDYFNPPTNLTIYKPRGTLNRAYETYAYEATLNNFGEVKGYEPLVDTRFSPTLRCGIAQDCELVETKNAKIILWSPNKIILVRMDSKPIELDLNPSNYWLVNGKRIFQYMRTVEVLQPFMITDTAKTIIITAEPSSVYDFSKQFVNKTFGSS